MPIPLISHAAHGAAVEGTVVAVVVARDVAEVEASLGLALLCLPRPVSFLLRCQSAATILAFGCCNGQAAVT